MAHNYELRIKGRLSRHLVNEFRELSLAAKR